MRPRTIGRRLALQYLFMADMNGFDAVEDPGTFFRVQRTLAREGDRKDGESFAFDTDDPYQDEAEAFAYRLIDEYRKHPQAIDAGIGRAATNWSLSRMGAIERAVLRLAAAELRLALSPRAVVLDEAVELAKRFGSKESGAFVNGIADHLEFADA
ncbi:MAG: transcription antitermination factor NusB [Planctomycetes bacterium]|nr:transcription antitermination factor NusB [Planctomycetota bacterium]